MLEIAVGDVCRLYRQQGRRTRRSNAHGGDEMSEHYPREADRICRRSGAAGHDPWTGIASGRQIQSRADELRTLMWFQRQVDRDDPDLEAHLGHTDRMAIVDPGPVMERIRGEFSAQDLLGPYEDFEWGCLIGEVMCLVSILDADLPRAHEEYPDDWTEFVCRCGRTRIVRGSDRRLGRIRTCGAC
jgi:hypothetical protein